MNDGIQTYNSLAIKLNVSVSTADNVVRDLVMVGHAEANRISGAINLIVGSEEDAGNAIVAFCRSHVIIVGLTNIFGYSAFFTINDFISITRKIYPRSTLTDFITETYAERILSWCIAADIIEQNPEGLRLRTNSSGVKGLTIAADGPEELRFFGEVSPESVLLVLEAVVKSGGGRNMLQEKYGRKPIAVLRSLGLLDPRGNVLLSPTALPREALRDAAKRAPNLVIVSEFLAKCGGAITGLQVGHHVGEHLAVKWSDSTKRTNGTRFKRWAKWVASAN